eukprot:5229098-Lingulodinium_polyedra.AAC.1
MQPSAKAKRAFGQSSRTEAPKLVGGKSEVGRRFVGKLIDGCQSRAPDEGGAGAARWRSGADSEQ